MVTATSPSAWWSQPTVRRVATGVMVLAFVPACFIALLANPWFLAYPALTAAYGCTGILLWLRRSDNAVGPLLTMVGTVFLIGAIGTPFGAYSGLPVFLEPSLVPILAANSVLVASALVLLLPLLRFPDGRLPAPGWRWIERGLLTLIAVSIVPGLLADPQHGLENPFVGGSVAATARSIMEGMLGVFPIGLMVVFAAMRVRYRRGSEIERKQLKWLLTAIGSYALFQMVGQAQRVVVGIESWNVAGFVFDSLLGTLIPVSILIAVMRYRLYEIDRIVSRTVTYGSVGLIVALAYVLPVLAFSRLLGGSNDLVVAASTLTAAAVFNPARRRIQEIVERRFNRTRFDAEKQVELFGERLQAETDLVAIEGHLDRLMSATVAPERVGLWIR